MHDTSEQQKSFQYESRKKIEKSKEKRSKVYLECISSVRTEDPILREKQEAVFKELPDIKNLAKLMRAGFRAKRREFPEDTSSDYSVVQGLMFEEMVNIENDLYNFASTDGNNSKNVESYKMVAEGTVEGSLGNQLVMVFQNADRYGYKEISKLKNPDMSFVETDETLKGEKKLKVIGVGEAKSTSKLDVRCLKQFEGFHRNLSKVAGFLNGRDDTDKHGLSHFGVGEDKIKITVTPEKDFNQYLIVASDFDIDKNNPREYFKMDGEGGMSEEQARTFEGLIKTEKIKILHSVFSHQELEQIVNKLVHIIAEEIKTEIEEYNAEQESI